CASGIAGTIWHGPIDYW
nr:immunoglobulin heavy chain junction region [Macaca mulatta]MOV39325.1 immunoglobulin heavy chain junction region [Macaca mulatta]MOV40431.1 immunoglobulin heavy chain junction region [Macaca mulatta]MOV41288.1 immunoglobulin heavy chain junction region [Macaca mulatta]MOV41712.1 immunoglobulin heavy chain junction region [Macaca mulatta]